VSYGALPASLEDVEVLYESELGNTKPTSNFRAATFGIIVSVTLISLLIFLTASANTSLAVDIIGLWGDMSRNARGSSGDAYEPIPNLKPNFVMIVADDLGWNSLGYTDDDVSFATPILTNLGKSGIIMGNFYAQEVCSPSRASLLTGRYPLSAGMQYGMVAANVEWGMPLDEILLPEVLKDNGYVTHMLGKWHLGYFSPLFLPTARGFDFFTGYVNGENYYWSKRSPDYPEHVDLMESDTSCYAPYNESDIHDYSTIFYTNKAISIIDQHSMVDPLFLYLAYQAVHDPFVDYGKFSKGMPDTYLPDDILSEIHQNIKGKARQEYMKSLYILDKSVGEIKSKIEAVGQADVTYIIFMSDNGGCFYGGGKNGPLRGSKGALFEGGIKVDSFIYSPMLKSGGTTYSKLMHISDWFPTILSLAQISYTPTEGNELDGVNQVTGWIGSDTPRTTMLYNMYIALTDYSFNIWYNGSFAVRDETYKLMHTYNDSDYGAWYTPDGVIDSDDDLGNTENRCAQQFVTGEFKYWLFNIVDDPYETNNLYYSEEEEHVAAKEKLYNLLPAFEANSKKKIGLHWSTHAMKLWSASGNRILPWANTDELVNSDKYSYPTYCNAPYDWSDFSPPEVVVSDLPPLDFPVMNVGTTTISQSITGPSSLIGPSTSTNKASKKM